MIQRLLATSRGLLKKDESPEPLGVKRQGLMEANKRELFHREDGNAVSYPGFTIGNPIPGLPTTAPPDLQSVGGSRHSAAVSRHYSSLSLSSAAQKESGLPIPPPAPPTIDPFYDRLDTARQTLTFRASVPCTLSLTHSFASRKAEWRTGGRTDLAEGRLTRRQITPYISLSLWLRFHSICVE